MNEWMTPAYLVVELRKLHLHFFPLKEVILGLFTHRGDQVELPRHRIRFLCTGRKREREKIGPIIVNASAIFSPLFSSICSIQLVAANCFPVIYISASLSLKHRPLGSDAGVCAHVGEMLFDVTLKKPGWSLEYKLHVITASASLDYAKCTEHNGPIEPSIY